MPDISAPDAGPASSGPNASVPFGAAPGVQQLQQRLNGPPGPPPGTGAQPGQPPVAPQGAQSPVQPPPPPPPHPSMPTGQQRVTPLSPQRGQSPQPWRAQLRVWADHPLAGPSLRALARLANLDQNGSGNRPAAGQ